MLAGTLASNLTRDTHETTVQRADEKDLFRSCIMAMGSGVLIQDADGAIVDSNEAAASLLGISRHALVGLTAVHPGWAALRADHSDLPADRSEARRGGKGCVSQCKSRVSPDN